MGWWRSRNFWKHAVPIQIFPRVWRHWTRPSDTRHDHDTCHGPENILSIWKYTWIRIAQRCTLPPGPEETNNFLKVYHSEEISTSEPREIIEKTSHRSYSVREFSGSRRERSRGKKKKKKKNDVDIFPPRNNLLENAVCEKGVAFKRSETTRRFFHGWKNPLFIRR